MFIVWEVGLEPPKRAGFIVAVYKTLELIKLLVCHFLGQTHTDIHLKPLVNMLQEFVLFVDGQTTKSQRRKKIIIKFEHTVILPYAKVNVPLARA